MEECPPRKLLLVKMHAIGDLLLATPTLRAIRRRFPEAEIHLLVCDQARPVVANSRDIDRTVCFSAHLIREWRLSVGGTGPSFAPRAL
jgi:ADP-heptose:LPS heptosyltransferase